MMRAVHVLVGLALALLLLAGGAALVLLPFASAATLEAARNWQIMAMPAGLVVLLLLLVYAVSGLARPVAAEQSLSFSGSGGPVTISVKTIRDFVARLGGEFPEVTSLQPTLRARRGTLHAELDVKVKQGTQIPELSRMLQERVKEAVAANFGVTNLPSVRVNVKEVVPAAGADAAQPGS